MEVEDALAFNERVGAHGVIAGPKLRDLDLGSQFCERVGDAALAFMYVDDDLHRWRLRPSHRRILDHCLRYGDQEPRRGVRSHGPGTSACVVSRGP